MTPGELMSALVAGLGLQEAKSMYTNAGSFRFPIEINGTMVKASSNGHKTKALLAALGKPDDS